MGLRVVHTADWHLGHTLHDLPRDHEHARFLAWLVDVIAEEEADALVVAGDVFESANPPASAQAAWYEFLARARSRFPGLDVIVIGGNHDSAARLEAPAPLLRGLGVQVIGAARGEVERLLVPITDRGGEVAAWVAAVPFLRPSDLPRAGGDRGADGGEAGGDPLVEGVRRLYAEVLAAARARRRPGQALLATGHCYMVGTSLSRLSERRILGGNQHALPVDIFPDDVAYVALGHLHKAQRVGGRDGVRYAGSPIPLSMAEGGYRHQVQVVDLDGERLAGVRSRPVPRAVEILRVPGRGAAPLDEVVPALAALADCGDPADAARPYLEVCVALPRPEPYLRRQVEAALAGKRPRLVKLTVEYCGDGASLADRAAAVELADLEPEEVFSRRYRRDHDGELPPELLAAFRDVVEEAR